jgi:hypothetical protein
MLVMQLTLNLYLKKQEKKEKKDLFPLLFVSDHKVSEANSQASCKIPSMPFPSLLSCLKFCTGYSACFLLS